MAFSHDGDALVIPVLSGMVIGPVDLGRLPIVALSALRIGIGLLRVKVVGCTDAADGTYRRTEVLVIAGDQHAASRLAKSRERRTFFACQAPAGVDCEQPQLIEVRAIDPGEITVIIPAPMMPIFMMTPRTYT